MLNPSVITMDSLYSILCLINILMNISVPNPPRDMKIEKVTSNSVLVHWSSPKKSEFQSYVIRYRTESEKEWFNLPSVTTTEADVTDMTPGEKYTIQVNTVSYGVESPSPQQVNQTGIFYSIYCLFCN